MAFIPPGACSGAPKTDPKVEQKTEPIVQKTPISNSPMEDVPTSEPVVDKKHTPLTPVNLDENEPKPKRKEKVKKTNYFEGPMTEKQWFITLLWQCFPVLNFLMLIIYCFSQKYEERRKWAKMKLLITVILAIFVLISVFTLSKVPAGTFS